MIFLFPAEVQVLTGGGGARLCFMEMQTLIEDWRLQKCVYPMFLAMLLKEINKIPTEILHRKPRIKSTEILCCSVVSLCDPMDYIVPGILQARILEWVAFPFSRGSCQHRFRTQVSHIAGRFFTS